MDYDDFICTTENYRPHVNLRNKRSSWHTRVKIPSLQQSPNNHLEAESCFHQALDVARAQQAKSWELRAATSLARLWQQQDKRQDAYDLLSPVYGWFTEGFDTADLQEAKALLEELRA